MTNKNKIILVIIICQSIWMFPACHAGSWENNRFEYALIAGEKHEILKENIICDTPCSVYENEALCQALKSEFEYAETIVEKCEGFFEPEYFLFDFNGDDQEDYLVSLAGSGFGGSGGNSVYIFLEGDVLKKVFDGTIRFAYSGEEGGYAPVMVLNEKTDGLYDIAFDGYDAIWQYSEQDGRYQRK